MSTPNDHLVTAQLAIYAFLVIPSHYLIFKHGWHGLLGIYLLFSLPSSTTPTPLATSILNKEEVLMSSV